MSTGQQSVPAGWVSSTVGELFEVVGGGTPSTEKPEFWGGDIPWISSADINEKNAVSPRKAVTCKGVENSAANVVPKGSVIVATRVGLGKVGVAQQDLCFSQDCQALVGDPTAVHPWFAAFQMTVRAVSYRAIGRGTTISGITKRELLRTPFHLAPSNEQARIVDAIETQFTRLDSAEEALKRAQAKLKRYRASVLQAAVEGRLVPTEAELARREGRDYEPASVLLERILHERRRRWEETQLARMRAKGKQPKRARWREKYRPPQKVDHSSLPGLPEGWCWASVDALSWTGSYGTSQKCSREAKGPAVLRIPNVRNGAICLDDMKYATSAEALDGDDVLRPGDFIFIRTNGSTSLIGRGAAITEELPGAYYFASYLIRLRLAAIEPFSAWFSVAWNSPAVRQQLLRDAASSAGQHNVSLSAVRRYGIPIPPRAEQIRILDALEAQSSTEEVCSVLCRASLERLSRFRQSVLSFAFQGSLVDQDPNDEPASMLLHRVKESRQPGRVTAKESNHSGATA